MRHASINHHGLCGNVARLIGGEEDIHRRNVLWSALVPQRNDTSDDLCVTFMTTHEGYCRIVEGCIDPAGTYGIDADLVWCEFLRQSCAESYHRALGSSI